MRSPKNLIAVGAVAVAFAATAASAQTLAKSSLSIAEPIEVGGTVLPAGDYMIQVLPSNNRSILQITNEDQTKTFATVLTVPHTTPVPAELRASEYVYFPAAEGTRRVLRTWFPRDSSVGGHDIAYPQARAMELAAVAKEPVVTYNDGTKTEELEVAELRVVTPDKRINPYVAPRATERPMVMAQTTTREPRELPQTASQEPMIAAFGLLLLLAGIGIHLYRAV